MVSTWFPGLEREGKRRADPHSLQRTESARKAEFGRSLDTDDIHVPHETIMCELLAPAPAGNKGQREIGGIVRIRMLRIPPVLRAHGAPPSCVRESGVIDFLTHNKTSGADRNDSG